MVKISTRYYSKHRDAGYWLKAVNWFNESHSGEMGSTYTNHMWRLQGPDKFTSLLIICVSRERNVIHRHLQWEFLPWHSCDLFRFRHDVLEEKSTLNKKRKAFYRHHITNYLHFKNQWNNIGSQVKCEKLKKSLKFHKTHTCKWKKHAQHTPFHLLPGQQIWKFILLPDISLANLHWNSNKCVTSISKGKTRCSGCP